MKKETTCYLLDATENDQQYKKSMKEREPKGAKRYLDICTSHLRQETLKGLQPDKWPYSYPYTEGVFITICDDTGEWMANLPEDLQILIRYAWDHNIQLIRLDCDAEEIEELPRYDRSSI